MKTGFIGCGNMASAMIRGMLSGGVLEKEELMASAKHESSLERIRKEAGILTGTNGEVAAFAAVLYSFLTQEK